MMSAQHVQQPVSAAKAKPAASTAPLKKVDATKFSFEEIKAEFFRISWTKKEERNIYTKVVVVATFILGMAIYASDLLIQSALWSLSTLFRLLFG
jgi:preprotein translocase SecE subunit